VVFSPREIADSEIRFEIDVLAGEQLRCDWFGIPVA
jgi:hypothetical protein